MNWYNVVGIADFENVVQFVGHFDVDCCIDCIFDVDDGESGASGSVAGWFVEVILMLMGKMVYFGI